MASDKNIGDELLKQNGIDSAALSDAERKTIRDMLARDKRHIKRLKWVMAISWPVAFIGYLAAAVAGAVMKNAAVSQTTLMMTLMSILSLLLLVGLLSLVTAIVSTVSLLIRARSLNAREIRATLDEIAAQLKRLAEKEE